MTEYPITDAPKMLRDMRLAAKLQQKDMWEQTGKFQSSIARHEKAHHKPTTETIRVMAKAYGFDVKLVVTKKP